MKNIENIKVLCYIKFIEACHTFRGHLLEGGCHLWDK